MLDNMYVVLFVVITLRCVFSAEHPLGHKKPLGSHTKPGNIEVLDDFPTPLEFYHNYVKIGRPVLFKSVMNSGFPAFEKWTDAYLRKTYGRENVDVELGKKETRKGELNVKTFSEFLDSYGQDNYMVQNVYSRMMTDIGVPRSLQCGGFQNQLLTSIMWFSSGGTKSVLHLDTYDNINCILDGTKEFIMFDKAYHDEIEADDFVQAGAYSKIDVDSVDLYKTPRFSFLPWFKGTMSKGDCFYLPWKWFHQVNSFGKRNIAVNIWFSHLFLFNDTDCKGDIELKQFKPLNTFKMAPFTENLRHDLIAVFHGLVFITRDDLKKRWGQLPALFDSLDLNKDSLISWEEMYAFDVQEYLTKYGKNLTGLGEEFWKEMEQALHEEVYKGSPRSLDILNLVQDIKKGSMKKENVRGPTDFSAKDEF